MGDKIQSKKLAKAAGVSTVPGFMGEIRDEAHAKGHCARDRLSRDGEGLGRRRRQGSARGQAGEAELARLISVIAQRGPGQFRDGRLLIEKFVSEPRHIEIQLIADKHGNVIHLNERECSIQRRHQKVIEEAPSPFWMRRPAPRWAHRLWRWRKRWITTAPARSNSLSTATRNFYFLEMNTRLQVEHPVTELVTGLDLVELMIRSPAGEKLPLAQKDVKREGWAIEARVYAEDPYRGFLPSTGRLTRYRPPAEATKDGVTIRNDTGVFEGGEISVHYDPMIAKLSTHAPVREKAVDGDGRRARSLRDFRDRA